MKMSTGGVWQRALAPAAVLLVGGIGAGWSVPSHAAGQYGGYDNGGTIQCESTNNRMRNCPTGGRDARMVRQLSDSPCIEGRSWGTDRNGVWVSNGCRAQFALGGSGGGWRGGWRDNRGWNNGRGSGNAQTIRCESSDRRQRTCAVDTGGGVQLTRQLSGSACVQGRDWDYSRDRIWVSNGCRAEFTVGMGGGRGRWSGNDNWRGDNGYRGGAQQTVRCESRDGRQRYCDASIRGNVQVQRQLSDTRCIEGQNWGWDRRGIWVAGGCRADFAVY